MSGECGHFLGPTSRSILSDFAVCLLETSLRLAASSALILISVVPAEGHKASLDLE